MILSCIGNGGKFTVTGSSAINGDSIERPVTNDSYVEISDLDLPSPPPYKVEITVCGHKQVTGVSSDSMVTLLRASELIVCRKL